jgi:hypothetical protein
MNQTLLFPNEIIGYGVGKPAPLSSRVSSDNISPHLLPFEIEWLESILGRTMLQDMISKMAAQGSNYNPNAGALVQKFPNDPNYESLFNPYIVPYVGQAFLFYYLPYTKVQIGNSGAHTYEIANATPASAEDLKALASSLQRSVDNLKQRLLNYLCENKIDYPLFDETKCPCSCNQGDNKKPRQPLFVSIGGKIDY